MLGCRGEQQFIFSIQPCEGLAPGKKRQESKTFFQMRIMDDETFARDKDTTILEH
jgi:hypothetical protein